MQPNAHLNGQRCPMCSKRKRYSKEDIINVFKEVHGNKYDYSKMEFKNTREKVEIICHKHGSFWQSPRERMKGSGCPMCCRTKKLSLDEFILKSIDVHGFIYDYSKVVYVNNRTPVCIICPEHGEFWQIPDSHLQGHGCPLCKSSRGEKFIERYLRLHNIDFISQYKPNIQRKLFSRNNIKVDFYLPKYNTIIEFNGIQHYEYDKFFHGKEESFLLQLDRDKRVKEYCKKNKINLITIKYNQLKDVEKILNKKLRL